MPQKLQAYTTPLSANNYSAASIGTVGFTSSAAGVTTSVGLATTYTGLVLANPTGSSKNLIILEASAAIIVATAAVTALGLAMGVGTLSATTVETQGNAFAGSSATLAGQAFKAATLSAAPLYVRSLGVVANTSVGGASWSPNGGLIVPPGSFIMFTTNVASPASGFTGSFLWAEMPH